MKRIIALMLLLCLAPAAVAPLYAADKPTLDTAVSAAAAYMLRTVKEPAIGMAGGDWAVIGLARSGYPVSDAYYESYYRAVEKAVRDGRGILHDKKYTEYSRVILGLTAAGYDPRDVAGYDLTVALGDFERTIWQGISGPVWALLALDSANYPVPANPGAQTQATRELYIGEILRRQLADGGWNLTAGSVAEVDKAEKGDPDVTGMVLQAFAKYQDRREVRASTSRAIAYLSTLQEADGGYSGWGDPNAESVVQVLVALCELGISVDDARFVKNGKTLVDNILSYRDADGSYRHTSGGAGNNQMASEQALYGLAAAKRALEGKDSLYRMSDATARGRAVTSPSAGLPGKHADVHKTEISLPGKTFRDIDRHAYRLSIEELACRGVIGGRSAEAFEPEATMTRAEFAAIVTRALGLPVKSASVFVDVAPSAWYAAPVATAYYYGIVGGTSATTYTPDGTITRQEAAVMVARAAGLAGLDTTMGETAIRDTLAQFDDYRTVTDWARPQLAFCVSAGILADDAMVIQPANAIHRGEVADMLYRMLDRTNLL